MAKRYIPLVHGAIPGRADEQDTIDTAQHIAECLRRLGHDCDIVPVDRSLTALTGLVQRQIAVVFNLVEALDGDDALAVNAFEALDRLGLRYTGASAEAYARSGSKIAAKGRLREAGIPTPDYWPRGMDIPADVRVIIKSVDEHGSLGIDAGSIVTGAEAAAEIRAREARFGGTFFAEEYMEGREFNAALLQGADGVRLLPVQEIDFSDLPGDAPPIVDYAAKWDPSSAVYHTTPRRFGIERTDPALAAELARLARAAWDAFELTGYARVDFRVSRSGTPTVLEVNANPCLAPDAGFAAASAEAGLAYDEVIDTIVRAALPAARKAA
ncbi:MAG: hypothetical protein ACFCUR_09095 [Rhodomicrobiaceae bacterium]